VETPVQLELLVMVVLHAPRGRVAMAAPAQLVPWEAQLMLAV
jgi:hypothetical protein